MTDMKRTQKRMATENKTVIFKRLTYSDGCRISVHLCGIRCYDSCEMLLE